MSLNVLFEPLSIITFAKTFEKNFWPKKTKYEKNYTIEALALRTKSNKILNTFVKE